jgi:hypothetical protein
MRGFTSSGAALFCADNLHIFPACSRLHDPADFTPVTVKKSKASHRADDKNVKGLKREQSMTSVPSDSGHAHLPARHPSPEPRLFLFPGKKVIYSSTACDPRFSR